ncbi:sn-glycerol-1-phosphate dehydrogenase [Pedosphaera parvula]|uniref:Glutamate-1-semialdehyde 2,1-aminomutase n=1 Tax=Pedosphaera parvula (strain Ellin514) TaxID=320771 RepID=B9XEH8_PEDPL|nr:sn-glycerol-1-phosphate dehydrogenase [Pedosphaera parvula]EEF61692.1 Glutamate-1-semialdehyde 2,1-aminomutase [Pedosphaera parvula Ellin514]
MAPISRRLSISEALQSARETRAVVIGKNNLGEAPGIFQKQFPGATPIIISDETTFGLAGAALSAAFEGAGIPMAKPFIFTDPDLYAEYRFVTQLENALRQHNAIPVALGSGTINDLTKLAAHNVGRSYMCMATAASMDGYTAFGASITYQGSKQTFNCPAPVAVLADLEIIRHAPTDMTASGYADLLAKVTAGADWILAAGLGIEKIDQQAWDIVQGGLREALNNPAAVRNRDAHAINSLTEGLMLGGFAMQWTKSSRPASGAEHQFSHLWDMQHHTHNGKAPSHGFKVGIATLAITALYEQLLKMPLDKLDIHSACANWPDEKELETCVRKEFASDDFTDKAWEETRAKYVSRAELRAQLEKLRQLWPTLQEELRAQLIPYTQLKQMLQQVGAPVEPEQIGISRERLKKAFVQAYYIRRRFTVLDVARRAGVLHDCLNALFGKSGIWPI